MRGFTAAGDHWRVAVIGSLADIVEPVAGRAGTRVSPAAVLAHDRAVPPADAGSG